MPGVLDFFTTDEFLPHAYCLVENPSLIRLHIASDATTAAAYYSIPLALGYFAYKRREDIPFSWMFTLFGAFILLCGTTHLFGIWTLYVPDYYSQGILKAATGLASIGTAIVTWRLLPALLLLPGPEKLRKLNTELETLVASRTSELQAALAEKEALLSQAYHRAAIVESSDDAIIAFDLAGKVTEWNHAAEILFGQPSQAMIGKELRGEADGRFVAAQDFLRLVESVRSSHSVQAFDVSRHNDPQGRDISVRASPIRGSSGAVQGVSVIARDIAERLRNEERMRTVMLEVEHRARNMLAVVVAMIRMTKHDPACNEFVKTIQGRIEALSASHAAVVENKWDGAYVAELVARTLRQVSSDAHISCEGGEVLIAPVASQALGIVLHELATNARKHGALSSPQGQVLIRWTISDERNLTITWSERGGPPAEQPSKTSLGMRLITRQFNDQLEGTAELDWHTNGLTATFVIPAAFVIQRRPS